MRAATAARVRGGETRRIKPGIARSGRARFLWWALRGRCGFAAGVRARATKAAAAWLTSERDLDSCGVQDRSLMNAQRRARAFRSPIPPQWQASERARRSRPLCDARFVVAARRPRIARPGFPSRSSLAFPVLLPLSS